MTVSGPSAGANGGLARSFELWQSGSAEEAARLLDDLLRQAPDDPDVFELAGLVALARGAVAQALTYTEHAARIGTAARYHANHGVALGHAGQHAAAAEAYREALRRQPAYPEAHNNLGLALALLGQPLPAEQSFRAALALRSDYAEAWTNLGDALQMQGRLHEAVTAYREGIARNPRSRRSGLGHTLRRLGQREAALASYRADTAHYPDDADAFNNLAAALIDAHGDGLGDDRSGVRWTERARRRMDRLEEALGCCRKALALRPDLQQALCNTGNILRWLDRAAEAEPVLRRAIALRPSDAGAYNNLGLVLQERDRPDEALAVLDLAQALAPEDAEIQYSRATGLLRQGRLQEGWAAYDCRFRIGQAGNALSLFETHPPWAGEPAAGRTLLVLAEQGLGDTLQFVRYAPLIAARGLKVVIAAQAPLLPLLKTMDGVIEGDIRIINQIGTYPRYDLHCPMLSLPRAFGTTLETIPASVPYLKVPEDAAAAWVASPLSEWVEGRDRPLRVGLAWGGNPRHVNDLRRSIPLASLAPFFALPGIRWFNLQLGERREELQTLDPDLLSAGTLTDLSSRLTDFAQTAAAVSSLDLVICADTAVAHLAGALGKPVWVMLPHTPDWRWLAAGRRSPWYPSMRLFRQTAQCRWHEVALAVADELAGLLRYEAEPIRTSAGEAASDCGRLTTRHHP